MVIFFAAFIWSVDAACNFVANCRTSAVATCECVGYNYTTLISAAASHVSKLVFLYVGFT